MPALPRRPDLRSAPGSVTAAAGVRVVGFPKSGGARREEEAQEAEEAAEEAETTMASLTKTVGFRLRCHADAPPQLISICAAYYWRVDCVAYYWRVDLHPDVGWIFLSPARNKQETVSVSELLES